VDHTPSLLKNKEASVPQKRTRYAKIEKHPEHEIVTVTNHLQQPQETWQALGTEGAR
jgi:hypothetical protein